MSLLFNVIFAAECTSTHHKLALDALRHLRDEDAARWRKLFLKYYDYYLDGAKAPDKKFKDFRNHVLHVSDNYWGGAVELAEKWYEKTVRALRQGKWKDAAYAAGVLSHYYTDPLQPLHTGQTEEEGAIHRAVEWSIAKSYEELQNILEEDLDGYPNFEIPEAEDWLTVMVREGAELSHQYYDLIVDHYDLAKGVKDPPSGLDQEIKDCVAQLVGHAAVGFSRILEEAFDEADVDPPDVNVSLLGYLAALTIPIAWVTRKLSDVRERAAVQAMYKELQNTGRVLKTLPADDREVRRMHAEEVLKVPLDELNKLKPRETGTRHAEGEPARSRSRRAITKVVYAATPPAASAGGGESPPPEKATLPLRFYLKPTSEVVDAPSIGPKTARRLEKIGVNRVAELLDLDPEQGAAQLGTRYITADTIRTWQSQAGLICRIPNLRGHDAQILVGCDLTDPAEIASLNSADLIPRVESFSGSEEGQRILRDGPPPDKEEVEDWIEWARHAKSLQAA